MAYSIFARIVIKLSERMPTYLVLTLIEKRIDDLIKANEIVKHESNSYLLDARDHYKQMENDFRNASRKINL
jgi:hypothetical protein